MRNELLSGEVVRTSLHFTAAQIDFAVAIWELEIAVILGQFVLVESRIELINLASEQHLWEQKIGHKQALWWLISKHFT